MPEVFIPRRHVTEQRHGLVHLPPQVRRIIAARCISIDTICMMGRHDLHYSVKDTILVLVHAVHEQRHVALYPEQAGDGTHPRRRALLRQT